MTPGRAALGVVAGLAAGTLSGAFGVGGGILTQPAIRILLGGSPIVAVATSLPVIFPTALAGAAAYHRAGQVDLKVAGRLAVPGAFGAVAGAALADVVNAGLLLIATAGLLAYQATRMALGKQDRATRPESEVARWKFGAAGAVAGFASGLLGVGGGIIMVPLLTRVFGLPLKRALGTSLVAIVALVVPSTIVHALLGNIDWAIFAVLTIGVLPGARIGAALALRAKERNLRLAVGGFLILIAIAYGVREFITLAQGLTGN